MGTIAWTMLLTSCLIRIMPLSKIRSQMVDDSVNFVEKFWDNFSPRSLRNVWDDLVEMSWDTLGTISGTSLGTFLGTSWVTILKMH